MATDLFLPADGLSLLGQHEGSGVTGRRFLVGRGDGQVVQLPLLPYLIMAAIAEGGVDGGWSADQIGARVGTASGQGLTADTVRYLVAGKLAPLGLIADGGADRPPDAARAAGPARSWPAGGRLGRLVLPHRRRRWALAVGGAAALVCVAATAPIMAETGNGVAGRNRSAAAPEPAPAAVSVSLSAAGSGRTQAAAWVAQQVSGDVTVWCDPAMCEQLRRDGFPAARLRSLSRGVRGLPGSGIVVATAAVRGQFGSGLAGDAP